MAKIMIFIDGTWIYKNITLLKKTYGQEDFRIDFGKLPRVLADEVGNRLNTDVELDVVRTYLFGSYASNYDIRDEEIAQKQLDFYDMLKEEYHYELELFPVNFRGYRLRREDRAPGEFFPREKCVDISLASAMLYYAAIPNSYDIAIGVMGDQDFKPVLQLVRRLGKRIAIASIKGPCSYELADPLDEARIKDFDIIWLDDILHKLELKHERRQLECQSPFHKGDRKVWTTMSIRKGKKFYCPECYTEFSKQKQKAQREFINNSEPENASEACDNINIARKLTGMVVKKVAERGFGFINADDGASYFFHLTDLASGLEFEDVLEGITVSFEVKKEPDEGKAGAAREVRRVG